MSAKDTPVAYKPLTFKQLKAFAEKLRRNGLPPGTPLQFVRDCDCVPYGTCPVCTAKRGQSVFVREPNEDGE